MIDLISMMNMIGTTEKNFAPLRLCVQKIAGDETL